MQSLWHVSLDPRQVKSFVHGHTVVGKKCVKWSVVRLEVPYGCVDCNCVFCVLAVWCGDSYQSLGGMYRVYMLKMAALHCCSGLVTTPGVSNKRSST
jgi:hypothetical protein